MLSRPRFLVPATTVAVLALASTGVALEKTSARYTGDDRDAWSRASTSCLLGYYNICTGWIWAWSGWDPSDTFGVWFSSCCTGGFGNPALTRTSLFFDQAAPSGYGFTGSLDVWNADGQGCPTGTALRTSPFLPTSGWNQVSFAGSPVDVSAGDFVVTVTVGPTSGNPAAIASDHPSAGATGPAACGTCFPANRASRSFYYGPATSAFLCPGTPLPEPACDPELLWDVDILCTTPVEGRTWGQIKGLYR